MSLDLPRNTNFCSITDHYCLVALKPRNGGNMVNEVFSILLLCRSSNRKIYESVLAEIKMN